MHLFRPAVPSCAARIARAGTRLFALLIALADAASAQSPAVPAQGNAPELSIESIMARDWIGTFPESPYWSDDGRAVYYLKRRAGSEIVDRHRVDVATGRDELVAHAALATADYPGVWSNDRKVKAWVRDGDLWAKESPRGAARQITRTPEEESAPLVLTDGRIAFRRDDDFYAFDLASGRLETLIEIRFGKDPDKSADPEGFLGAQQRRLFQVLDERERRKLELKEHERARREGDPSRAPRAEYFADDRSLADADLAPSGRHLLIALGSKRDDTAVDSEGGDGGKGDDMPVFITDSGYVETRKVRPKVGTGKPETPQLFLLDLAARTRIALDLDGLPGRDDDPLAELRAAAEARRQKDAAPASVADSPATPEEKPSLGKRPLQLHGVAWSDDGGGLALQLLSHDNKDRWIATVNLADGRLSSRHRQTDPAWLGWRFTDFGWSRDGRAIWYLSEESGFSHLYLQPLAGDRLELTEGPFEVDDPLLSRDGRSFFVSANREQAGTYEAYRVPANGAGALERLTSAGGESAAIPSPDEKQLLLTSSWATRPPDLFVQPARAGGVAKRLTRSTTPQFDSVAWVAPEIVQVPSAHFAGQLQARVYDLPAARPASGAPAVIFIHGAGYLQNAHAGWSSYFREFMFHTLLARAGYVVLDMDYRASSGYGRDHRTAIYRQMGWPEVEDLEDGVAWLVAHRGVDAARVGAYGGSYGGFLTYMAMFRKPELFAAGAALRPVSDWAHYNHGYTSAILNTPDVDPEAYDKSSPIEYAAGLARPLLICHGMVDDNVTFQDSVRLVQRLIELGKTELFETAIYPFEPHAFNEPSSWTDEYKRIWKLFETHLR